MFTIMQILQRPVPKDGGVLDLQLVPERQGSRGRFAVAAGGYAADGEGKTEGVVVKVERFSRPS